jgi:sulfur-oxidizing protein SoxA
MKGLKALIPGVALSVTAAMSATAQDDDVFAEYREMMGDDNPAIFVVDEGEEYWYTEAGPNSVTLEDCDLGLGPGVVEGAYAQLPRFFEDTNRVMDLEARLEYCMVELQGRSAEEIHAKPYSLRGDMGTEMEALSAWIAQQSEGMVIAPGQTHPEEQAAYAMGEQLFYYRAGPHDFSCATCHGQSDMRIRLQALANLNTHEGAAEAYSSWPAYRISEGVVRTMGWRMRDCFRQQRLPELIMGSDASIALQTYLAVNAAGAEMAAPGLKR